MRRVYDNVQLCAGLQVGIKGNLHALKESWPELGGWTFDDGTDKNPTPKYKAIEDGDGMSLAEGVTWLNPDPWFLHDLDLFLSEDTSIFAFEPAIDFEACLIDANNAFQRINRYLLIWNVIHRWHNGSRLAFNPTLAP